MIGAVRLLNGVAGDIQAEIRTAAPPALATTAQVVPRPAPGEKHEEEEWEDSRAHLVKH